MLKIRPEQMRVLEAYAEKNFINEMIEHSKEFSPKLCSTLSEAQLHIVVGQAIQGATKYGFTNRGSIRLYIEMVFLFGSSFDTDPQFPEFSEILNRDDTQIQRSEALYNIVLDYEQHVLGADLKNVYQAMHALQDFVHQSITYSPGNLVPEILREMYRLFPQKANYVENEKLTRLIIKGSTKAHQYNFPTIRGEVLIIVLMFALGHGCTTDLLYPWIPQILNDRMNVNPLIQVKQLEKKALTFLELVLSNSKEDVL